MKLFTLRFSSILLLCFCFLIPPTKSVAAPSLGSPSEFNYPPGGHCQNAGTISLVSTPDPGGMFTAPQGNITFVSTTTGEINLALCNPGAWQVRYVLGQDSSTRIVTILATDDASFSYVPQVGCVGVSPMMTPLVTGLGGGTFSASSALLAINPSTGDINVTGSPTGTYVITYITNGPCPTTGTDTIEIQNIISASFAYSQSAYCGNDTIRPDTINSPGDGVFSAMPPGLSIDPSTGAIMPGNSTPGIYVVTYNTVGPCPDMFQTTIEVATPFVGPLFDYVPDSVCHTAQVIFPFILGPTNLLFTADPGIVFDSLALGSISPMASQVGAFTITATHQNICAEVTSMTLHILDSAQVTLMLSGDTLYAPGPGSNFQWYLGGASIPGATSDFYVPTTNGSYDVHYQRQGDLCGTIGSLQWVAVAPSQTWLSLSRFYPNPSNGLVQYALTLQRPAKLGWQLHSAIGGVVRTGELGASARNFAGQLDFSDLPAGTYLLRLSSAEGVATEKIVLMR